MASLAVVGCLLLYALGYRFYSRYLATRLFGLRAEFVTPAHRLADGIDYVPTRKFVLFGHHYASITGLSPMLGPAIAVIWGWLPAMLWVVLGALLVGCVHDFGALVVSVRARGQSIGVVAEGLIGARAKSLLHAIIFFGVSLAMGVFVFIVARLFAGEYPQAVLPSAAILVLALIVGWLVRRAGWGWGRLTVVCFLLTLAAVVMLPVLHWQNAFGWSWLLLAYAWVASVLPVWSLLQPRDFLNSLLLYLGLGLIFAGFFVLRPAFVAPMVELAPAGAPPIFPFVFIVVACGAASGFHALVSSGTTAKQLDREPDARSIGYGGMIGESLLALTAVLACTAGFGSGEEWRHVYHSWGEANTLDAMISAFIEGSTRFVTALGLPVEAVRTFIAVVVVSFALTTLDSATRLLRFNVEEIGQTLRLKPLGNRWISSTVAAAAIGFFAFYRIDGRAAGLVLWELFGSTNQLLAGLTLLVVALYLIQRKLPAWPYLIPMFFMLLTTLVAMGIKLSEFAAAGQWLLLAVGGSITGTALWLIVEAGLALKRFRARGGGSIDPDIRLGKGTG